MYIFCVFYTIILPILDWFFSAFHGHWARLWKGLFLRWEGHLFFPHSRGVTIPRCIDYRDTKMPRHASQYKTTHRDTDDFWVPTKFFIRIQQIVSIFWPIVCPVSWHYRYWFDHWVRMFELVERSCRSNNFRHWLFEIVPQSRDHRKNKTWDYSWGKNSYCHQFHDRVNIRPTSNILWYSVTHLKACNVKYFTIVNEFLFRMSNLKTTCHARRRHPFGWSGSHKEIMFVHLCLCWFFYLH